MKRRIVSTARAAFLLSRTMGVGAALLFTALTPVFCLDVSGPIISNTVWTKEDNPVNASVHVCNGATLTINPGVVVNNAGITVGPHTSFPKGGAIVIAGSQNEPVSVIGGTISITSGPDSGMSSLQWCYFTNCDIRNISNDNFFMSDCVVSGSRGYDRAVWISNSNIGTFSRNVITNSSRIGLGVDGSTVSVYDCTFANNAHYGMEVDNNSEVMVVRCTIGGNGSGVALLPASVFIGENDFYGPGNIEIMGPLRNGLHRVWKKQGVPYQIATGVDIGEGATLVIEPGVTVLTGSTYITGPGLHIGCASAPGGPAISPGALIAEGTEAEPIRFSARYPGTSGHLRFSGLGEQTMESRLKWCEFDRCSSAGVTLSNHNKVKITDCTVKNGAGNGMTISDSVPLEFNRNKFLNNAGNGLYVSGSQSISIPNSEMTGNSGFGISTASTITTTITDCTIKNNSGGVASLGVNSFFHGTNDITGPGGIHFLGGNTNSTSRTWKNYGVPYRIEGNINVGSGAILTIEPGTIVRSKGIDTLSVGYRNDGAGAYASPGALIAEGTESQPILFTPDNSPQKLGYIRFGGVGAQTLESRLKWCIVDRPYNPLTIQNHNLVRISGCTIRDSRVGGVSITNCAPADFTRNSVTGNGGHGLTMSSAYNLPLNQCVFTGNSGYGIHTDSSNAAFQITDCSIKNNSGGVAQLTVNSLFHGNNDIAGPGMILFRSSTSNSINRTWKNYGVPYKLVGGEILISSGATLTIEPGITITSDVWGRLAVGEYGSPGALIAEGTESQPIKFTCSETPYASGYLRLSMRGDAVGTPDSRLAWCTVEKGGGCNLRLDNHNKVTISHCTFRNSAKDGVYMSASIPSFTGNRILNNAGDGIYVSSGSPRIESCVIANNSRYGIYASPGTTMVNNSLVSNASAAIYCISSGTRLVANNIIANNGTGIYKDQYAQLTVANNDIHGNTTNLSGLPESLLSQNGNMSVNPMFVDQSTGNYHIHPLSPCVNAGSADYVASGAKDMDGESRVYGPLPDIGADELNTGTVQLHIAKKFTTGDDLVTIAETDGLVVTAVFPDSLAYYVEKPDRSCGMRCTVIASPILPFVGQKGFVTGKMSTDDGERTLIQSLFTGSLPDPSFVPRPIFMNARSAGGGDFGGQAGIDGGRGLNNIGLLVTVYGRVTHAESGVFYLDDGSTLQDLRGVRIVSPGLTLPDENAQVTVTGICSCYTEGNALRSRILVRSQDDILCH